MLASIISLIFSLIMLVFAAVFIYLGVTVRPDWAIGSFPTFGFAIYFADGGILIAKEYQDSKKNK